ncbi:MAG: hypothetical protein Q9196_007407, partial [Gyalolechia fulgens]
MADELWPTVDKANAQAQSHGRIIRTMIAIADPSKPFERAGKGTVIRKLTAEKFSEEITALYSEGGVGNIQGSPRLDNPNNADSVQAFVREAVAFSFPIDGIKVRDELYVHRLDSLKTAEITAVLKAGLGERDLSWLSNQTLYANPTIERLTKHLFQRLQSRSDGHRTSVGEGNDKTSDRAALMAGYVQKYTKVWARGFRKIDDKARVEFLQVDYSLAKISLSAETYQKLLGSVDTIIHAAWKVNFNHSLESFEPYHIRGVGHLVEWQLHSENAPEIIFISSTSSVSRWPKLGNNGELIPEDFIKDHHAAQAMGYAESKNVAEHILYEASKPVRLSSIILC